MSFHHWMYGGCQCSSARCSRLCLDRPTLFGIFSAEIMGNLRSAKVEFRSRLRAVRGERALLADRVRTLEDPVLPCREAPEDLRLHRLGTWESEIGLHAGERVGRERGPR